MTASPAPVRRRWMLLFALAWLAIWTAQLTPVQLLLPTQLDVPDGPDGWIGAVVATGVVLGWGGLAGVIAGPVCGALSDRTRTRWGRRRPWLAGGSLVAAAALVATGFARDTVSVALAWTAVSLGLAAASAALTAMIADQLPEEQRALASALASSAQAVGIIVGVAVVVLFALGTVSGYTVLGVIIAVFGLGAALLLPDPEQDTNSVARAPRARWTSWRDRDFAWMISGRLVVNIGNALGTTLLLFFLRYGLDRGAGAEDDLLLAIVVYTVFVVAASFLSGWWSDTRRRRRMPTVICALIQAAAAVLLVAVPTWESLLIAAGLLGIGYGGFMTTGLAFATDLLPDERHHARDLGVVTVAAALGQLLGPLMGAALVAVAGGFWLLFLGSAVFSMVGAAMTGAAHERSAPSPRSPDQAPR